MIGNGVVVDPRVLLSEIDGLKRAGVSVANLKLSANAHLIMPYHVLLDTASETKLGKNSIGTTRRGIGLAYADKALRLGIRVQDLLDEKILRTKIRAALEPKQQALRELSVQRRKLRKEAGDEAKAAAEGSMGGVIDPRPDLHAMVEEHINYGHRLEPHIADTAKLCWDALDGGETVIFEGAQATLLDLDHGTYPFVTSSNPIAGAATVGAGSARPTSTKSGGSPRPTRPGSAPARSRPSSTTRSATRSSTRATSSGPPPAAAGAPAGSTWSASATRSASTGWMPWRSPSSTSSAAIGPLRVAVRYRSKEGAILEEFPYHQSILHSATPEYEDLPGFDVDLGACRTAADLPAAARDYLAFIAEFAGVPVKIAGVGPSRDQVVWID